jgi:phage-related minor tail protein
MSLRVSLVIDGDASGAKKAAGDATVAVNELGAQTNAGLNAMRAAADANVVSLARVRAELDRTAKSATANLSATTINSRLGVTEDFGAAARQTDIDAYGASLDRVRAKFDPLFAAGQQYKATLSEINSAARVGAIDEKTRVDAIQRTKDAFTQQVAVMRGSVEGTNAVAGSSRAARAEMINLSRQVQDVGVSLASGQSPFLVAIQQGSQIADVFASSERSIGDFFKQAASGAARFLSPAVLTIAAVVGIGAAIVTSASQYGAAQREIELSLTGIGRASGALRSDINAIAANSASTFGLSTSEARSFATALAATGKIGKDNIEPIVKLGHDTATAFGTDAAGAAQLLAKSFADPVKGATELNNRLGFLDAATLRQITNLQAQNRIYDAQQLLISGVKSGLDGVNQNVSTSTKFWSALGNGVSNTWDAFGRSASRLTGIGFTQGLDEQLGQTKQNIADLQKQLDGLNNQPARLTTGHQVLSRLPADTGAAEVQRRLDQEQQKLKQLEGEWQRYWDSVSGAQQRRDSIAQSAALSRTLPGLDQLDKARNDYALLALTLDAVNRSGGASSPILQSMGRSYEDLAKAVGEAKGQVDGFKSSHDAAIAGLNLQIGAVGKRSPSALGDVAFQQSLLASGSTGQNAVAKAELERTLAIKTAQQGITDAQNQQMLAARQRVDSAQLELGILGRGGVEQERQRAILQAKQQLEQDALRTYGDREAYDRKHLTALTAQIDAEARIKQQLAEQQAARDVSFERSQIGRTTDEQQVASRLRGIYGDDYQSQLNGSLAQGIRSNQDLSFNKDTSLGLFKDLNSQLLQGKNAGEAFGNALDGALQKVESRLLDMALNGVWDAAFGGKGGSGLSGIFSSIFGGGGQNEGAGASASLENPSMFDVGGYTGNRGTQQVAGFVHGQEFVFDAETTRKAGPANLEAWRKSIRGYAGGGYVGPPVSAASSAAAPAGGGLGTVNVFNQNGSQVEVKKRRDTGGRDQADIYIKGVVNDGMANGEFASNMNVRQRAPNRVTRR